MLFETQVSRKPNLYPWTSDFIRAMHDGHWTVNEFDFESDAKDFAIKLNEAQRQIIVRTLSAIGQIEIAVKKFWAKLGDNLPHPSITDLGYVMANIEVIHNEAYERLLVRLGLDDVFLTNLQEAVIAGRVAYLQKYNQKVYTDNRKQYVYAIVLFTLFIENASLFSQFYVLNWFGRYKNVLKDTNQQTDYTRKEEILHFQAGAKIINTLREEYPELFDGELEDRIMQEAQFAYDCECKVIDWILGGYSEANLSSAVLKDFVGYQINQGLTAIGYPAIFEISSQSEFLWMIEESYGVTRTDFFFRRPTEYSKGGTCFDSSSLFD